MGEAPKAAHKSRARIFVFVGVILVVVAIVAASYAKHVDDSNKLGRDGQRRIDINSIANFTEAYFKAHSGYPGPPQLQNDISASAALNGISLEALRAPGQTRNSVHNTATPNASEYGYKTFDIDGTTPCNSALCPRFTLYWYSESENKVLSKSSLN